MSDSAIALSYRPPQINDPLETYGKVMSIAQMAQQRLDASMFVRMQAIIDSMTPDERRNPSRIVDQSRRRRIATGAGVELHEVSDLVKQFDGMASMMKGMAGLGMRERMQQVQQLQSQLTNPNARIGKPKGDTGRRLTADERRKLKKQRDKDARRKKRDGRG